MRIPRCVLMVALGIALAPSLIPAQQREPPRRQTIGVALGGGSAPGLAHVGVLR